MTKHINHDPENQKGGVPTTAKKKENQGFNDDNVYRNLTGGGWAIDHPDGSTTIVVRSEPLQIPPREWLVKGVDGEWYDSNDMVSDSEKESYEMQSQSESDCSDSKSDTSIKATSEEEEIKSSDFSEQDNHFTFNNEILYNLYHDLGDLQDTADIFKVCKEYALLNVPPECWAKSNEEINDESAAIYSYLQELKDNIAGSTEEIIYNYYCAGVNTYNIAIINGVADEDRMVMIFDATVARFA